MTMQNKPQLSAEMEKRFKSWYSECGLDPESDETAAQHQYDGLHFLATALGEQRDRYLKLMKEQREENTKARNFIKVLINNAGGAIILNDDIRFDPEKWSINRTEAIGKFSEVLSLEPILNGDKV